MSRRWREWATVMLAVLATPAAAQPAAVDPVIAQRASELNAAAERSKLVENGVVESTPRSPSFDLFAGRDASTAKLTLKPRAGDRWSASVTTPIRKGDPSTELLTVLGPAEDVELSIALHEKGFVPIDVSAIDVPKTFERREAICIRQGLDRTCTAKDLQDKLGAAGAASLVLDFESVEMTDGRVVPIPEVFTLQRWKVEASVGRTQRSYFDGAGEELDEDRLSSSFGGSYGRLRGNWLWEADARWQRKYEPQTPARRCSPVEDTVLERCKDLPLGRAAGKDLFPIGFEIRTWSSAPSGRPWAISPRVVYEVEEGVWAARLPVYLVADTSGLDLTGGVAVDWQEGKDTVFSVFISAPVPTFF